MQYELNMIGRLLWNLCLQEKLLINGAFLKEE